MSVGLPVPLMAVARLSWFEIVEKQSMQYWVRSGRNPYAHHWVRICKIARRKSYSGAVTLERLKDFTLQEHQAVLFALKRIIYDRKLKAQHPLGMYPRERALRPGDIAKWCETSAFCHGTWQVEN